MFRLDSRPAHYALLVALWAVLCLPNLGTPSLWDIDEGNNAECFREMLDSGNLVVPTFNYRLREDKPALIYWLQIACAQVVGVNEWSARLPSALAALLTVAVTYELGRRLFSTTAALLGAMVLGTSFAFLGAAHFANPDALLVAFSTLCLAFFWHDWKTGGNGSLSAVGAAAGLAVLSKGPVGLVVPAGVAFVFLLWQRDLRYLLSWRVGLLLLAFLLVAAPWYALVAAETKGAWIAGFLNKHNLERATRAMEGHSGPFYYYLPVLLVGLLPWSVFLAGAAWHSWRRLRDGEHFERAAVRLLIVWFATYVVLFSLAQTKLPNYVLPSYPAAALLLGHFLDRWRRGEVTVPTWLLRLGLCCLALFGAGVVAGLLIAGGVGQVAALRGRFSPGLTGWAWLGLLLVGGAAVASWCFDRGRRGGVIASVCTAGVLFMVLLSGPLSALDQHKAPRALAAALPADHERQEVRLAAYGWFQPSLVFYARREIERPDEVAQVNLFLAQPLPAYLFVPEQTWGQIESQMPPRTRVVGRKRDLYTGRMIVVVSNGVDRPQSVVALGGDH